MKMATVAITRAQMQKAGDQLAETLNWLVETTQPPENLFLSLPPLSPKTQALPVS